MCIYIYTHYKSVYINTFHNSKSLQAILSAFPKWKLTKDHPSIKALLYKKKKERNTFPEKVTLL